MDDEEKRMMQEMEEGELSDEEESTLASANSKSHHHQAHHQRSRGESQNESQGAKSSVKEKTLKPENETLHAKPIKKRKIDEAVENEKPTTTENDTSDVESFLKKRKQELAEKVKSQLRLAGIEAKVESGSDSDPECIKPDEKGSRSKRRNSSKLEKPTNVPKYYDLDKIEDPTETMISNWSKGKSLSNEEKVKIKSHSPTIPAFEDQDPLEEYYQSSVDKGKSVDKDYRILAGNGAPVPSSSTDQDYRFNPGVDVDYRRRKPENPDMLIRDTKNVASGGESDGAGVSPQRYHNRMRKRQQDAGNESPASANEYGDIDERKRSAALPDGVRRHGSRRSGRRDDEIGSLSSGGISDDEMGDHPRGFRHFKHDGHRGRRSPFRRRGMGRLDNYGHGPPGSDNPPICKFYREGYCREGENCLFSHNVEQMPRGVSRKTELCRFYKTGYCRNGRTCPFMHGEFPCKDFHKNNDCKEGEKCRFSHESLTDATRPLFEKMLKEEELYVKVSVPDAPSRRKVLLGEPPKAPPPINGPHPAVNHSSHQDYDQNNLYHQPGLDTSYYDESFCQPTTSGQSNNSFYQSGLEQSKNTSFAGSKDRKDVDSSADSNNNRKENGSVDITAMLREIKAEVKGHDIIDESPASPEPSEMSVANAAPLRQTVVRTVEYRLIPFDLPSHDPAFAQNLLKLSMVDVKLSNDPRLKKLLASQFDAVSDLIAGRPQDPKLPPIIGGMLQQIPQTKARDPRLKSSSPTNLTASNFQTPSTENIFPNVSHNQPMLYPPMMPSLPSEMLANFNIPPMFLPPNGPTGWMPHHLQQNPPMPIMHGLQNFGASSSHNFPMENDTIRDPRSRRARPLRPNPPAPSSFYNSTHAASSNSPPDSSKSSTDHRSTISPSPVFEPLATSEMTNNGNGNISVAAKNDNEQQQQTPLLANAANAFSTAMNLASGASANSSAPSLREKRKNLEYESPLNATVMPAAPPQRSSSTDDNSCRFYGAGLKIVKKKESVETS